MAAEFKKIGVGWLTKDRKGIRGVLNEDVPSGAKVLIKKNTYKTDAPEDEKKPDYNITQIIEHEDTF